MAWRIRLRSSTSDVITSYSIHYTKLYEVIVFTRAGQPAPAGLGFKTVQVPLVDVSATEIRERRRAGRSIRYLVPERVLRYIETHRLYQSETG